MTSMQQQLADRATTADIALNRAQQLLQLNETLTAGDVDVQSSRSNLEALLQMQQRLIGQSPTVTDAMQALEILLVFQEEFAEQIQLLGEMRRNLIEIG